jgi:hypothetical protein
MPDFTHSNVGVCWYPHLVVWTQASHSVASFLLGSAGPQTVAGNSACIAQREQSLILDSALLNSTRIRDEQTVSLRDP